MTSRELRFSKANLPSFLPRVVPSGRRPTVVVVPAFAPAGYGADVDVDVDVAFVVVDDRFLSSMQADDDENDDDESR
jgi:hypothetical protein